MYLGSHMSIAGGLHMAFDHISKVGGTALQIFTRNQRQWKIPPLTKYDLELFGVAWEQWGEYPIAAHDSYLINLASHKEEQAEKSILGFSEELRRIEALKVPHLVTHPGSHLGEGVDAGIERYTANLDVAIERSGTEAAVVLLETTAGQGSNLGSRFEELGAIIAQSKYSDRLGVCYDTCHTFAAGYDIRTAETYAETFDAFEKHIGLDRLKFFHMNDTKHDLNSHKDRHEHIGEGGIGLEGFRHLMQDSRFAEISKTLETPKDKDLKDDMRNLATLRELAKS
jgi:deoxyribonuclease-4